MKPSIGASRASAPIVESISGNVKKSRSLPLSTCWATKDPEEVHARLLLLEALGGLLPGPTQRGGLVQRQQLRPGLEDGLDLGAVPGLLVGHEIDVELVAVDPHVEDVEGPHRRPAVLVGERDRREPVLLHLGTEALQLVEGLRHGVAVLREDRRPVEHRPWVVVQRHEVLLAVITRRRRLERIAEAGEVLPHVADVADEALGGEEPHPVAGEPREDVVRLALEVVVDVLLEGVVVDRVDLDGDLALLAHVGVDDILHGLLRDVVGVVRAEGERSARRAAARGSAAAAAPAGGQQARDAECRAGEHRPLEH